VSPGRMGSSHGIGLGDALEALRDGTAGGLVVFRLDRLARDMVIQETLLGEIRRMRRDVFSSRRLRAPTSRMTPTTPHARSSVRSSTRSRSTSAR
jgi:DNA invertase Pin-like site-specific DNA recombinase